MGVVKDKYGYTLQFFYQGKRYRWAAGKNKKEADSQMTKIKSAILDGTFEEKYLRRNDAGKLLLSQGVEWYDEHYIRVEIPAEKNREDMRRNLARFIEIVGDLPVEDVRVKDIERYKMARLKMTSKKGTPIKKISINRELGIVSGLFSKLAKYEEIEYNPLAGKIYYFPGAAEDSRRDRYASIDELRRIFAAIDEPEFRMIVLTAMTTGMRRKDIMELTVRKIDFEQGVIRFKQSKTRHDNVIPLSGGMLKLLKEYIERMGVEEKLFTLSPAMVSTIWLSINRTLKITPTLQFRDLRRTFGTMLHNYAGADIKLIAQLLGHRKIDITDKVYTISETETKRAAVRGVEEHLGSIEGLFGD